MEIKPILFNTPMVQAILDGRKTATRRLIKPRYREDECGFQIVKNVIEPDKWGNWYVEKTDADEREFCPQRYINPPFCLGDILYVRETWCWCPCWDCGFDTEEHKCCNEGTKKIYRKGEYGCYCHKASEPDNEEPSVDTWHTSIHMPKEAARIWLRVTDVRVERLQEMKREDVEKEGIYCENNGDMTAFMSLWDSTVKKSEVDKYGWAANPWVWVIEFERCEQPKKN